MAVAFAVPQELNVQGAAAELRRKLSTPRMGSLSGGGFESASVSETSSSGPKGVARRIRRSSSNPLDAFTVDILEPYDPKEPARFEFKGACTQDNLNLLESVMHHAAQPRSVAIGGWIDKGQDAARRAIPPWFGNLENDELEAGLEQFFEPLRELVNEFERLHSGKKLWGSLFSPLYSLNLQLQARAIIFLYYIKSLYSHKWYILCSLFLILYPQSFLLPFRAPAQLGHF